MSTTTTIQIKTPVITTTRVAERSVNVMALKPASNKKEVYLQTPTSASAAELEGIVKHLETSNIVNADDRFGQAFSNGKTVVDVSSRVKALVCHADEESEDIEWRLKFEGLANHTVKETMNKFNQQKKLTKTMERLRRRLVEKQLGEKVDPKLFTTEFHHKDDKWMLLTDEQAITQFHVFKPFLSSELREEFYLKLRKMAEDPTQMPEVLCMRIKGLWAEKKWLEV